MDGNATAYSVSFRTRPNCRKRPPILRSARPRHSSRNANLPRWRRAATPARPRETTCCHFYQLYLVSVRLRQQRRSESRQVSSACVAVSALLFICIITHHQMSRKLDPDFSSTRSTISHGALCHNSSWFLAAPHAGRDRSGVLRRTDR